MFRRSEDPPGVNNLGKLYRLFQSQFKAKAARGCQIILQALERLLPLGRLGPVRAARIRG